MLGAIEEHRPASILHPHAYGLVGLEARYCADVKRLVGITGYLVRINVDGRGDPLLGPYVLTVHAGIGIVGANIYFGQLGSLVPHLDVPYGRHVPVLLGVGDGQPDVPCLAAVAVDHRRALHDVACTVGKQAPCLSVYGCLYEILIEEGGIFKLRPYLAYLPHLPQVYLQPLVTALSRRCVPVGMSGFPQRGVVVINGIFRLKPLIVIGRCRNLCTKSKIFLSRRLEEVHTNSVVRRHDGEYIASGVERKAVDTHLTVEAMNRLGIVMAVINDIVVVTYIKYGMMAGAMDSLVLVGG